MVARCSATTASGAPCNAQAQAGTPVCRWHDPDRAAEMAEARRRGGAARSSKRRARREMEGAALSPAELQGLIGATIRAVLAGTKPPAVGSAIAALCRAAVAVREATEVEERLAALEQAAGVAERRRA